MCVIIYAPKQRKALLQTMNERKNYTGTNKAENQYTYNNSYGRNENRARTTYPGVVNVRPQSENGNYYGQNPKAPMQRPANMQNPSANGAYRQQAGQGTLYKQPQGARQYPGQGKPRQGAPSHAPQYTDRRWVPLFAGLLALFIIIGIIFTISKASERKKNPNQTIGQVDTNAWAAETGDPENENNGLGGGEMPAYASTYAIKTDKTVTLGAEISSDYAIMIDLSNNTVVAEKNSDNLIYPASMTKIMTLIVAYENCKNLDDKFTMTQNITDAAYQAGASVAGFMPGEEVSVRDLLYGAILPSGADATDALAVYTAGSEEAFVELMNKKILKLGLSNTHFTNSSGLHDKNHYSTPHEIALILEYALKIDECRKILSTYKYTTAPTTEHPDGIELVSTMFSRMVGDESGVANVIAGKTGYTNEGLHCLASLEQTADGKEYVLVTAHSATTYGPIYDCIDICKKLFGKN